jgi:hypothetical protein
MRTIRITSIAIVLIAVFGLSAFGGHAAPLRTPTNPGITNLVAWWSLNETSGTRYDSHGLNHLTDNNTVGYEAGIQGNAALFLHDNAEYLSEPDAADISLGDEDFTFAFWVKFNTLVDNTGLIGKWSAQKEYTIVYTNTKIYFSLANSSDVQTNVISTGVPTTGRWYFIVARYNAATDQAFLQLDDATTNTATHSGGIRDGSNALSMGKYSNLTSCNCSIDQVSFYKRALSSDELTWLYNSGNGREYCEVANNCATPTPNATATAAAVTNTAIAASTATAAAATNTAIAASTATAIAVTNTAIAASTATAIAATNSAVAATDIAIAATNSAVAATETAAAYTPTYTPTSTQTSTPTSTSYPTHIPGTMATAFWNGAITYGDAANVTAVSLLCLVVILGLLAWLTLTTLQRRKK